MDTTRTTARRHYGGLYADREAAERGIRRLREEGYEPDRIGVIARDAEGSGQLTGNTAASAIGGAATGALTGGVIGGLAGLVAGAAALAIPGIGPIIAGGVLASTLGAAGGTAVVGAGVGAAVGGVSGALLGLGFSSEEAEFYNRGISQGRYFITVEDEDRARAYRVFDETGADYYRSKY